MNKFLTKAAPIILKRPADITFSMLKFQPANEVEVEELLKARGNEIPEGYVAGWASTPDLDLYRHVVKTGAFDEAIQKRGLSGPKSIKLLLGHDWDKVSGVIRILETRKGRLWIEAQLNLNISYARDAYEAMKMSGGFNFSVGFMLQDYAFKDDENKQEYLLIERGDLFEVSIVPFPGNEEATMDIVKARQVEDARPPKPVPDDDEDEPDDQIIEPSNFKTVAEFEKSLTASGLVRCRNDAQRITHAVKCSAHLFRGGDPEKPEEEQPAPIQDPPAEIKTTEPVLAAAKLDELSNLIAKMRGVLAPVATS